jgi:hypothetical protein
VLFVSDEILRPEAFDTVVCQGLRLDNGIVQRDAPGGHEGRPGELSMSINKRRRSHPTEAVLTCALLAGTARGHSFPMI